MRTIPRTVGGQTAFVLSRVEQWAQHAPALGLDGAEVQALRALAEEAKAAQLAAAEAAMAAKAAALVARSATRAMRRAASIAVQKIRVRGESLGGGDSEAGAEVFALASVTPPKKPARQGPPPGTPEAMRHEFLNDGTLRVRWACVNPGESAGTVYEVERGAAARVFGESASGGAGHGWERLGVTGEKEFVDASLPREVLLRGGVVYRVTSRRGKVVGGSGTLTVLAGVEDPRAGGAGSGGGVGVVWVVGGDAGRTGERIGTERAA